MKKAKILLPALVLVLVLTMVCGCAEKSTNGDKITFTFTVTHADGSSKDFTIKTAETNLRKALEAEKLVSGTESEYGLFVTTVDGETADFDKDQSWWCLTKDGETCSTGVDGCTVADGDKYGFTYTIGY